MLDGRKGIATIFDTYLLAIIVALIAAELETRDFTRVEKLIHVLLAANALLALAEYALNTKVFPFRFEGVALDWDNRSNGLLGHPLENAQMTGLYIMVLLAGGGASMPKSLRPAAILLQLAALVPFGGRTALLLTLAMTALWLVPRVLQLAARRTAAAAGVRRDRGAGADARARRRIDCGRRVLRRHHGPLRRRRRQRQDARRDVRDLQSALRRARSSSARAAT